MKHAIAVAVGLFAFAALCGAQEHEYWLKIERNGVGFGWEHTRIVSFPGGQREYRIEGLKKIDLIGLSPQEIAHQGAFRVDEDLRPLSFGFRVQFRDRETQVNGQCLEGRMRLSTVESNGEKRERELNCRDVFFSVVLEDLILRRAGEKSFRLTLFDPSSKQLRPTEVRVTRTDATEVEAQVGGTDHYRIGRAGGVREVRIPTLSMRAFRSSSEDARNIAYLDTADGLTLTVRATGDLPNPFRAKKVPIAVAWRNVSPEEFRFEDKRQRVLRASASDGAHRVLLDLSRTDIRGNGIAAPVRASGFSEYLGEDEYIKPADPAVRRQLADIRGEETDAYAIVKRILEWMQANIRTDLIVETLSAPEVLERRSGKCSEHAILFASLARAAGIPVKIVLGEAATSRSWVGHLWNEVWIGEWLPVDPSMASFVVGPSHLKLVDAPTVAGTQSLRMKLVDNLALEILSFEEDQSASSAELKTGIVGNTYTRSLSE
ncbi:MAG: transglutaminase-like domain-containing protein [Acidobacteriota bacterium]